MVEPTLPMKLAVVRSLSAGSSVFVREYYQKRFTFWNANSLALSLIERLRDSSEPAAIAEPLPFGLSKSSAVSTAARAAMQHLYQLVPLEALPALDDAMRPYWSDSNTRVPGSLEGHVWASASDRLYLGLLASHRDGCTRAGVLRQSSLVAAEDLLPFIFIRLTDWVDLVRSLAEEALVGKLHAQFTETMVDCLGLLTRLSNSSRFHPSNLERIDVLLKAPACATALRRALTHPSRMVRRHCMPVAVENPALDVRQTIAQAIVDHDVVVRRWVFTANPEQLGKTRTNPHTPIRRLAFDIFETSGEVDELIPFLLDRATSIRVDRQRLLSKRFEFPQPDSTGNN